MSDAYKQLDRVFEKITSFVTSILGNSITFIIALLMLVFWFSNRDFETQETNEIIRDIIHGVSFLCLFVIQKEFSRFSGALHLKINELVVSHETANNAVINVETKTELEITELQKEYTELAEQIKEVEENPVVVIKTKTNKKNV
ncbi:MAG: low affinity iron permease family protein [Bacteroidota bacterium]